MENTQLKREDSKTKKQILAEKEADFQKNLAEFRASNSNVNTKAYENVFLAVYEACKAQILSRFKNSTSHVDDMRIHNYTLDATCMVMDDILKKNRDPQKLSSYVYFRCTAAMLEKYLQFEETKVSRFSDYSEEAEEQIEKKEEAYEIDFESLVEEKE